ncbi:MAG: sulfite exporter TauE/SafE family protein [Propionibacteriaceae bacterium]
MLLIAGVGSGVVGYGAGLASVVSFPTLLAAGLPPLAANVSNSVALTGSTLGGVSSARRELTGMRGRLLKFCSIGLLGGTVGAVLLLTTPPGVFERVVPWLVVLGSVVLLLGPRLRRLHAGRITEHDPGVAVLIGLVSVYSGYFGAAAGVLVLAVLSAVVDDTLARLTALRSAIVGSANLVAAVIFVATGPVAWRLVIPLALGTVVGAGLGPPLLRRLPETPVRVAVAAGGFMLAGKLFLDYG